MDVREKLVEILKQAPFEGKVLDEWWWEEKIVRIVDHLIANGVTVQEWISVKDRLPERNEDGTVNAVLVTNGAIQHIAYFAKDVFYFTENGEMKEPMFYEVTHWQHLPQPPKGE